MTRGTVHLHKLKGTPLWVFPWRTHKEPLLPKLFALFIVGLAFMFLITSFEVRVETLEKSSPRRESVIYLRDDPQGLALKMKAQEGGPFPSRFDLSQWGGMAKLEDAAMDSVRYSPPPYSPKLVDLPPVTELKPLNLAATGKRFYPSRQSAMNSLPDTSETRLAPVLYPLSGIQGDEIPHDLPSFDAPVDAAMSSASWRFLIRLNSQGGVAECVSLENQGESSAPELEKWLRRIQFKPEQGKPFRWFAVGVGFTNQPADDSDPR